MTQTPTQPNAALAMLRLVWAALLMGQIAFLGVVSVIIANGAGPAKDHTTRILFYVALGLVAVNVPMGYALRAAMYARGRDEQGNVSPSGYITGNLFLFSMCEGASLLALVTCLIARSFWPEILPSAIAMAVQVINFPRGAPLRAGESPFEGRGPR